MNSFYTNVQVYGNNILYRGVDSSGRRIERKIPFQPTLYLPSNKKTDMKTLDGRYVEPIQPGSIRDCREFYDKYSNVSGFELFGNMDFIYQYIASEFSGEVSYDPSSILVAKLDIETTCEHGFPDINNPIEQINAITVKMGDEYHSFGLGEFSVDGVECYCFDTEEDLIVAFLEFWVGNRPDIITGWNTRFFDIPYLVRRFERVIGEDVRKLSPWGLLREKKIIKMSREHLTYDIVGVSSLDYLELYRTFTYVNQESYRLDHIANVELGEKKLSYEEYDSMHTFYNQNFQKFMEYNIRDVMLIDMLEDKLKLLELSLALAYSAKVNYNDIFGQVRMWDQIIYHYLHEHNIVIPMKKIAHKSSQYAGAYVKEPIVGKHDWVVSFDLNSLYPMLICQYNISPETLIKSKNYGTFTVDDILDRTPGVMKVLTENQNSNASMTANGASYTKEFHGFLPSLMDKMYEDRRRFKKQMIHAQQELEELQKSDPNNKRLHKQKEFEIAKFKNFQLVRKIQLNSAYGAIGNQFFRYYNTKMAESITMSGQLSIRWIANKINGFLNEVVGTNDYDFVVASDTDSVYLRLGVLVDKFCKGKETDKVVDFLDKAAREIIQPFIDKSYEDLATLMNAYQNKMVMEREVIADKGIWTAKKRYILNVHDSEGVRYTTPKQKIMGIETTRSSTPNVVRQKLKDAIKIILDKTEKDLIRFVDDFRNEFRQMDPEDVAFPRGVSNLNKYADPNSIYKKSTPIAVKGALLYNFYLRQNNLTKKYSTIQEGDKVKFIYLKTPNPISGVSGKDHIISFVSSLPKEFDLLDYIDYNTQFEKSFLDPLEHIVSAIGWSFEKRNTLEGFFV